MKLEVGKWCRTEKGTIFKIIGGNVDMWEIDIDYSYLSKCENEDYNSYAYNKNNSLFEDLVVKSSYNRIDLIELGDYVNRNIVLYKDTGIAHNQNLIVCIGRDEERHIYDETCIKSIATKEQFEQMEYKIGE